MNQNELEGWLEERGWTIGTRCYGVGCWYAFVFRGTAQVFRYSADDVTREGARRQVCEMAEETQRLLEAHNDTERPPAGEVSCAE